MHARRRTPLIGIRCRVGDQIQSCQRHSRGRRARTRGTGGYTGKDWGSFPNFTEHWKLIGNVGLGQSSIPKWVLGTIEFIWVKGNPLTNNDKPVSHKHVCISCCFFVFFFIVGFCCFFFRMLPQVFSVHYRPFSFSPVVSVHYNASPVSRLCARLCSSARPKARASRQFNDSHCQWV